MSVEVLEERVVEAPANVETETQQERCATLGGAAIACAGCPFVRFCELKAEVEQGSFTNEMVGNSSELDDDIFGLSDLGPLFPEAGNVQEDKVDAEPQPEKAITPLPYEVKNTTINYTGRLMDDKIKVVFANSITSYRESSDSNLSSKPPVNPVPTEVEQPELRLEVPIESVKIEAQDVSETLELAYEDVEKLELTLEVAPADRADSIADHSEKIELIVNEIQPQIEEQIKPTKDLTENILRPKVNVVKKEVVTEPIQKIKKVETKIEAVISSSADSPIFYNDDFEEIFDVKEEPAMVEFGPEPEFEAELDNTAEAVDVIEILEKAIATEDAGEVVESIQIEAVKPPEDVAEYTQCATPEATLDTYVMPETEDVLIENTNIATAAVLDGNDDIDFERRFVNLVTKTSFRVANSLLRKLAVYAIRTC